MVTEEVTCIVIIWYGFFEGTFPTCETRKYKLFVVNFYLLYGSILYCS